MLRRCMGRGTLHRTRFLVQITRILGLAPLAWAAACVQDVVPGEPPLVLAAAGRSAVASGTNTQPSGVTAGASASTAPANAVSPASQQPMAVQGMSAATAGSPAMVAALPPPSSTTSAPDTSAAAAIDPQCDLRGGWLQQNELLNSALGSTQIATTWSYHRFEQQGTQVRVVQSLDCGLTVRGTTDVSISDATLEAVATRSPNATGVRGSFTRSADGSSCTLAMERTYSIRGADRERFLNAVWKVGDPPRPLSDFPLPMSKAAGMEDWDGDGHEGITVLTGLGDRYFAQVDFYATRGQVPLGSTQFGGKGVLFIDHDQRDVVSAETPLLLQAAGIPMPPGYAFMARVEGEFSVPQAGEHALLDACRQVQALSVKKFGDPPRP